MSRTVTFGIVGGCGATGRMVASELWKSREAELRKAGVGQVENFFQPCE
jgi:hypothetical protein